MRDLIVTENITLDGVIDVTDDWFRTSTGDDMEAATRAHMAAADALLIGRVTYEQFYGFWPKQTADTTGVREYLNRTRKYVVSSSMTKADWQNTAILSGRLADDIGVLKHQPGKDIVATGSVSLVRSLADTGLIDGYRLFVFPVVIGKGRRLFPDGIDRTLQLVESKTFTSGVVLLSYRVAQATLSVPKTY